MKLTVVGCSGSCPGPDSPASCYLLEAPYEGRTFRILLDLGSGALGALQQYAALESIDAVLLSHLHADHCLDLCGFYVVRKYRPDGALPTLPVYGPAGASERICSAYDLAEGETMSGQFDFRTYREGPFTAGPFEVVASKVDHPVAAYGLRVSVGGRTLTYTGDTGPCEEVADLAKGADLLLAEASFLERGANPPNVHMTGREAAVSASDAGVRRLVITHVPPWYSRDEVFAEARPHFDGELTMASPGATYEI
jgi:ribonuclease BN (tRNA processing enzyme)